MKLFFPRRPGLAYIMHALGAESYREDERGYVVWVEKMRWPNGECVRENYLVRTERLEAIERYLKTTAMPERPIPGTDFVRLANTDC